MIVCTCDTCGRVVENWTNLNINLANLNETRQVCNDCQKGIKNKVNEFLDSITVTNGVHNDE